jgi:CDP-glucose 4,6-dehydratase
LGCRQGTLEGLAMNRSFWRGKRVLVTGHTGFKGSWLCLWLQELGANVAGYALEPPTDPSLFDLAHVGENMQSTLGDIRDYESLAAKLRAFRPEIVIHMAAQPLVRLSYDEPVETYSTNVMGTVHLLEAIRQLGNVRAVVNITSDKCYENREWVWGYRENEPMGGFDPYSNSKGCAELVTAAYRSSYFNPARHAEHDTALASARAGNVIGGGDWAKDRLVPDIMNAFLAGRPVDIRNPNAIRPWQHVLEPLHGYLLLAEKLWAEGSRYAEGWNFGPQEADAKPVQWIVERLAQRWGNGAQWTRDPAAHPHEATYLKLDCAKARSLLGWHPVWDIGRTLDEIVAWYQAYAQHADLRAATLAQIGDYEQSLQAAETPGLEEAKPA